MINMSKIRSLFVNPSRDEWALAIAKYFFPPERAGSMIRIDVNKSILEKIVRDNGWRIPDPISSICDVLTTGRNIHQKLFYSPFQQLSSNTAGYHDYLKITNSNSLDFHYHGFPRGIVEFSLGMVVANEHFSNQDEFSRKINGFLKYRGGSMFSDPRISENLRKFLASLDSWCKSNVMDVTFRIPDFPDPTKKWYGWGYIGRFYDHLEVTEADKKIFLRWINRTLEDNPDIDLEDLQYDRRDLLERSLYYYHDHLSPRLKSWHDSGINDLKTKFWEIVEAYLFHLTNLRNNRAIKAKPRDSFEEFELTQIKEKKNKVRPMITVEYIDGWGPIEFVKLNYFLDEIPIDSLCSVWSNKEPGTNLPLTDGLAHKALTQSRITVDGVELIQNKTGIYPICVLLDEDLTLKSRYMIDDSEVFVSKDTEFSLLCFGSKALDDGLEIARRLSTSPDLQYSNNFLFLPGVLSSTNQTSYYDDYDDFHLEHLESVFIIPNLVRNGRAPRLNDPKELSSSSKKQLIGIRHRRNLSIFHNFAGHPELKVNPTSDFHLQGQTQVIANQNNKFKITQKIIDNRGITDDLEMEYEYRELRMDEIFSNNSTNSFSLKQIIDKNDILDDNIQSNVLANYINLTKSNDISIKDKAEDHSGKIFLNDKHTLSEILSLEASFPDGSKNKKLWESRVTSILEDSTLETISQITPDSDSDFLNTNPKLIPEVVKKKFDSGDSPKSLLGLHKLNIQGGASHSKDRYGSYINDLNRNYPDTFFRELSGELNRFTGNIPIEIVDAITKLRISKNTTLEERISNLRLMESLNDSTPEAVAAKEEAAKLVEDLIGEKPYNYCQTESILNEALGIIENYSNQYNPTLSEWVNTYNNIKSSIINFDLRSLQSTPDLKISPGTVWVYLSRQMEYSWFSEWNDGDKAARFNNYLLKRINRLSMHPTVKEGLLSSFLKVTRSTQFRNSIMGSNIW